MTTQSIRVLCIGENVTGAVPFSQSFMKDSDLKIVHSTKKAYEMLRVDKDYSIILCGLGKPEESIRFFEDIKNEFPDSFRFFSAEKVDSVMLTNAINAGQVYYYFKKTGNVDELEKYIREAHYIWALKRDNFQMVVKLIDTNKRLEALLLDTLSKKKTKVNNWNPTL